MRRIGSFPVNVLRMIVAAVLFVGLSLVRSGYWVPQGQPAFVWRELALSGLVGFVIGDLMLFHAFLLLGGRLAMLIYSSVPAMTALGGFFFLNERIRLLGLVGMALTTVGIAAAVAGKRNRAPVAGGSPKAGIWLAIGGSAGQAAGLLLGKHGASTLDAFAATEIRVLAGLGGFLLVAVLSRQVIPVVRAVAIAFAARQEERAERVRNHRMALLILVVGGLFGPFLGVSLGLLSVQLLPAGIASTLMALVPVLMIPVSAVVFHERVTRIEIAGTLVALFGVGLLVL